MSTSYAFESTSMDKGLTIAKDVMGFNLDENTTIIKQLPSDSYKNVIPQENILCSFGTGQTKLELLQTFANGELRKIYVLDTKEHPELTDISYEAFLVGDKTFYNNKFNEVKHAKDFLTNYGSYSEKAFYSLLATIFNVVKGQKNETIISGNTKFEATIKDASKTFRWTYINSGIEAPSKCVVFGYENGYLKYFIDNWDLYAIGSTQVNISEKRAIEIALEASESFSWNIGSGDNLVAIKNFTVANAMLWETVYCSSLYADVARNEDSLALYPLRHIWVSLDKFYPANVYGFNVYIWADTGEICSINERFYTLDPPIDMLATEDDFSVDSNTISQENEMKFNSVVNPSSLIFVLMIGIAGIVPMGFFINKKKRSKLLSFRLCAILSCFLILSATLMLSTVTVKADITRRALIWGSESTGGYNSTIGGSTRKTSGEISQQQDVSSDIRYYFASNGYTASNYQGSGSMKAQILANISDAESNYANVAVVDFNHGIGRNETYRGAAGEWHFQFEDQIGMNISETADPDDEDNWVNANMVFDMDIYDETDEENTFFAFINTCLSAYIEDELDAPPPDTTVYDTTQGLVSGRARGMPFAWTHRTVLDYDDVSFDEDDNISDDGYGNPDEGDYCYIGFPWGSAALNQIVEGSDKHADWVTKFFYYALSFDISINNALDEASLDIYNEIFRDTALATNFSALWPMYNTKTNSWTDGSGFNDCTMVVYGNGNIHLFEYYIDDHDRYSGYGVYSVTNPSNIEGATNDGNDAILEVDFFEPYQIPAQAMIVGKTGWDATGHVYLYGKTASGYSSKVQVWVSMDDSTYYQVGTEKTVTTTSDHWIDIGTYTNDFRYIAVVCYADSNNEASKLYVDSVRIIPDPTSAGDTNSHYVDDTSEYEDGGTVDNHAYMRDLEPDDDKAHIHCSSNGDMGQILGTLNGSLSRGYVRIYGTGAAGYSSDLYVYASDDEVNYYQIGSKITLAGSGTLYWINVGHYYDDFEYVAVVGYHSGNAVCMYFDCFRVLS